MELIDKSVIAAIIKKKLDKYCKLHSFNYGAVKDLESLLNFIDILEVKDVDLEKEFYDFLDTLIGKDNGHLSEDELFSIAEHFYELGLKTKRGE